MCMATRVWACGTLGVACPDDSECHTPNFEEYCDGGEYECCFESSTDDTSKALIVVYVLGSVLIAASVVCCIYKQCKSGTKETELVKGIEPKDVGFSFCT